MYDRENKKLVVNQIESEWVKKVFDRYNSGVPVNSLRKRLSTSGVMTRRGNTQWHAGRYTRFYTIQYIVGSYVCADMMIGETVKVRNQPYRQCRVGACPEETESGFDEKEAVIQDQALLLVAGSVGMRSLQSTDGWADSQEEPPKRILLCEVRT